MTLADAARALAGEGPLTRNELRERLEREEAEAAARGEAGLLHRRLAALDADAAARIHPNDLRRTIRALEIGLRAGARPSVLRGAHGFADRPYRVLHLALDPGPEALDARTDARCVAMIEAVLLHEVRDLLARGFSPDLRPFQAIGYRHLMPVAQGVERLGEWWVRSRQVVAPPDLERQLRLRGRSLTRAAEAVLDALVAVADELVRARSWRGRFVGHVPTEAAGLRVMGAEDALR